MQKGNGVTGVPVHRVPIVANDMPSQRLAIFYCGEGDNGSMSQDSMPPELQALAELALEVGLELQGTLPTQSLEPEIMQRLKRWLDEGRAGEMKYLHKAHEVGENLQQWKPWARGAALFVLPYHRAAGSFRGGGRVARYALGRDYHNVLGKRLERLGKRLRAAGLAKSFRATVDAAPVLEREWAIRGGLGWRGKNTLLLHPVHGPWVLLGELVLDFEVPAWSPPAAREATCGSCTRCLDACPTDAFTAAYELDPRKCISYLTIETKGEIPLKWRRPIGEWVFGCDVCQEVCPFGAAEPDRSADWPQLDAFGQLSLEELLHLSEQSFHKLFTGSPLRRPGWAAILRNVCVVLGNLKRGAPELEQALLHPESLVRGHAAWALGEIGERKVLHKVLTNESDPFVRKELEMALSQ